MWAQIVIMGKILYKMVHWSAYFSQSHKKGVWSPKKLAGYTFFCLDFIFVSHFFNIDNHFSSLFLMISTGMYCSLEGTMKIIVNVFRLDQSHHHQPMLWIIFLNVKFSNKHFASSYLKQVDTEEIGFCSLPQ